MYLNKNWYNEEEINEFLNSTDFNLINEVASVKTRMKLARAARRTARRRAFIRKLKAKRRKQLPALKKRAYNEVKTAFRKKLYKGKWSRLSYSSRARIDAMISRKKPILNRMVKRIMPAVIRGETQRLASLNKKGKK
jgi:hypothetical protein